MWSKGYLNVVKSGKNSHCFFVSTQDVTFAIQVQNGESVYIKWKEDIVETKVVQENESWFLKGYENLSVLGLPVEIDV